MTQPDKTTFVIDSDVLIADLLIDGKARQALDLLRSHSWITVSISPELITECTTVLAEFIDDAVVNAWEEKITTFGNCVTPTATGNRALACAKEADAAHVITYDQRLLGVKAGVNMKPYVETSVKTPDSFLSIFEPEQLYEAVYDSPYEGPDQDPRK
ncbi:MAG: hypothetical protein ABEI86_08495 [Halobacteriaceae archaeon]